jgi:hypothetical protein
MIEFTERDKYGRTVRHCKNEWSQRTKVVIVTMPKAYREAHPASKYLVNDWQMPLYDSNGQYIGDAPGKVTYLPTLKAARALAESKM